MGRWPLHKQGATGRNASFGLLFVVLAALAGCSNGDDRRTIDVYAASSLVDIMNSIEDGYEADNPEVDIRMNLAGTNALVRQINSGAEAAILVAADASLLDDLSSQPVAPPVPLASNELVLIVPGDNPADLAEPADLATGGVLTARCATGVPCGDATDRYLTAAALSVARSTEEANVRSVLAKVSSGEVDAGFVYRTDALAAASVVEIPLDGAPRVTIAMAQLDRGEATTDLADYMQSAAVAERFGELGFGPPNVSAGGASTTTGAGGG